MAYMKFELLTLVITGYNEQLVAIYEKYKGQQTDTFAVTFQPADINIAGFPVDALR